MRRTQRLIAMGLLLTLTSVLGGCGSVPSWDPSDLLDFLDTKKRVVGDRKPVFPEGVPGLTPGVPKDLVKGTPEYEAARSGNVAVGQPVEDQAPQAAPPAPKGKQKSTRRAAPARAPAAAAEEPVAADDAVVEETPPAAPPPSQRTRTKRQTSRAPAEQQAPPAQSQGQQSSFPAPVPSGTFSR